MAWAHALNRCSCYRLLFAAFLVESANTMSLYRGNSSSGPLTVRKRRETPNTLADLPAAERMDPLRIRKLYETEKRVAPVTKEQCAFLTNKKLNGKGRTDLDAVDVDFLAHVSVASPAELAPSARASKMLCIAYTYDGDHNTKASAMVNTWMPRCDGAILLSNATNAALPSLNVPHIGEEAYNNIWQKSRANWKYVYDNYFDEYDFFVFGGTDYYAVVENMRLYFESDEIQTANKLGTPLYMGRRFTTSGNSESAIGQFNSGGPSYVLNKAALKLFIDNLENPVCSPGTRTAGEDVLIAACLRKVGSVLPYDTRDEKHRERFHPFTPGSHMVFKIITNEEQEKIKAAGKAVDWYTRYSAWGIQTGLDCCNPHSISWHYIGPKKLRSMDSLFYACRTPEMLEQLRSGSVLNAAGSSCALESGSDNCCAFEGEMCKCDGTVRYGTEEKWSPFKDVRILENSPFRKNIYTGGSIACTAAAFGSDPAPMKPKHCQCKQLVRIAAALKEDFQSKVEMLKKAREERKMRLKNT